MPADLADLADRASTAGEGNPLFVEELVRMLVEQPHTSVPPTIHALLAARLERLDPAERAVVEAAGGGREVVRRGGCLRARGRRPVRARPRLRALERKDLIQADAARFAGEPTFSFKHILIRDVAYQGILKEARADFHERFADWLERTAGERAGEYEEILGHHLARACAYLAELGPLDEHGRELAARAAARLGSSGRRALARGDFAPAVKLLDGRRSLLAEDDPARRDLALKLGIALAETGEISRADALLHDRIEAERRGRAFVVFNDPAGKRHVVDLDDESPTSSAASRRTTSRWPGTPRSRGAMRSCARPRRAGRWSTSRPATAPASTASPCGGGTPLRDGDVLRFGDTVVLFRVPLRAPRTGGLRPAGPGHHPRERPSDFVAPREAGPD